MASPVTEILAEAIKNQGGNKSEIARKLGKPYSSQQLGQYEIGPKQPKIPFYFRWKEVFKEDLLSLIETKVSAYSENEEAPGDQINGEPELSEDGWRAKYIKGLEEDKKWFKEVFKSNLTSIREDVRTISARQKGTGDVVLHSLERLEKKKKGELVREADKQILQIDKEGRKPGTEAVPRI